MPKRERNQDEAHSRPAQGVDLSHSVLGGLKDPTLNSRISGSESNEEDGVQHFKIPFEDKAIVCERRGEGGEAALIFTHGAGGGVANPATRDFASGFAMTSPIVCFQGTMNLQSRIKTFHATIESQDAMETAIGGRSMGARAAVATALEREKRPSALVLVSYPLTGGKKGEKREKDRENVLVDLPKQTDVLFVFGSEDVQCDRGLLNDVAQKMIARSWFLKVDGADHSMSLKDKSAVQRMRMWTGAIAARWLADRDATKRYCSISWNKTDSKVTYEDWHSDNA